MKKICLLALLCAVPAVAQFTRTPSDLRIEENAQSCYNLRVVLAGQGSWTISALNGIVTLSGTVADEESRALAGATLDNIRGVARVENELVVLPHSARFSDAWIERAIRRRLLVQAGTQAATAQIVVKDGMVRLTGTCATEAQKELTGAYASQVAHVVAVENDLTIDPASAGAFANELIDDASLTTQMKNAISGRRAAAGNETRIRARDGLIMINGLVESEAEKQTITDLARRIRGVQNVVNNMKVRG